MNEQASLTALLSAFARAYHLENSPEPVFRDTAARRLLSDAEYERIKKYLIEGASFFAPGRRFANDKEALSCAVNTQLGPTPLSRARFAEDSLKTAVKTGTAQYVILGAGLDTFAWREGDLLKKLTVFEVDHPLTQADKRRRLQEAGLSVPENLRFVPADFLVDDLKARLLQQGFDETKKTFFSLLGVAYYLSEAALCALLQSIASFAAEGSTLLFDYGDEGLFSSSDKRVKNMLAMAQAGGEPMVFSADELSLTLLLDKYNFLLYEALSPEEINARYFSRRDDGCAAFPCIRFALTVLKGTPLINTREKILQTALKLFSQNGYEAVSMQNIADALSLTKAALYKHYSGKQAIFEQICQRMAEQDQSRARAYGVPERPQKEDPAAYKSAALSSLLSFTEAQYRYWTEDPFACRFRRMLTLEQFRSTERSSLYRQYFSEGPFSYTEDILRELTAPEIAEQKALSLYGALFFLYGLYDGTEDKSRGLLLLQRYLKKFSESFYEKENENELSAE